VKRTPPRRRLDTWQLLGLCTCAVLGAVLLVEVAEAEGWPRGLVAVAGGLGAGLFAGWLAERLGDP
jgi:hypothetical protein